MRTSVAVLCLVALQLQLGYGELKSSGIALYVCTIYNLVLIV